MPLLSAVLITLNEEKDVGRTIEALSFADEVLVVDSGSTDRTVEICRALGARVLHHPFQGYGEQKRWSVEQASHDWVLHLDADEVVTPQLGGAIRDLLDSGEPPCAAYRICFPTVFLGRVMRHGPLKARWKVRLFDRRRASWSHSPVHEMVQTDGPVGEVQGDAYHHTARDVSDCLGKLDAYTTLAARGLARRGKRRGTLALALTLQYQLFRHYVLQRNFLNGIPGLVWSILDTMGSVLKHAKARELQEQASASAPLPARTRGHLMEYPWLAKSGLWAVLIAGAAGIAGILPDADEPGEWSAVAALFLVDGTAFWMLLIAHGRRVVLLDAGIEARWWRRRRFVAWSDITVVNVRSGGVILSCQRGERLVVSRRMTCSGALARELLRRRVPLAGHLTEKTLARLSGSA